jgi:hypothetical protein
MKKNAEVVDAEVVNELDAVMPSEFYLTIKGKKRQVKFGNLALAKVERKYGTLGKMEKLQKDMEEKMIETFCWLLSISLKDKEGLTLDDEDKFLEELDDSNVSIKEVMLVTTQAMNSSMTNMFGSKK